MLHYYPRHVSSINIKSGLRS